MASSTRVLRMVREEAVRLISELRDVERRLRHLKSGLLGLVDEDAS